MDNGMVQVSLSTPQGHITAVRVNSDHQNLLHYNATQANSGGYVYALVFNKLASFGFRRPDLHCTQNISIRLY